MRKHWSTLKKLIWLRGSPLAGGGLPEGYEKVAGFTFNSNCYYEITGLYLRGSDTVRFSVSVTAACNVFGCYTGSSASDNYSLYASTSSGAKYMRYNGGTYNSAFSSSDLGERFDVVITPTGTRGMPTDSTWEEKTFESELNMCIGTSAVSASSAKLKGALYGAFIVDGRFKGIPCKRLSDNVYGYYDTVSGNFYEPVGDSPTPIE